MRRIGQQPPFSGFGPSSWTPARPILATEVMLPDEPRRARRLIRERCPAAPGVYGMVDPQGALIYVGKSRALRSRLVSYFYDREGNEKGQRIIAHSERLVWEPATHEFAALVRELELIRRWRPRFNVQGQPGRVRRAYVCVSHGPAPHAYLASQPTGRTRACFGPVSANRQARSAIERLNHYFQLRDCRQDTPLYFADQRELFPQVRSAGCLRFELGSCLGPCAAACTTEQYDRQVARLLRFLRGRDLSPITEAEMQMRAAATDRQFERAALWRDVHEQLRWMHLQLERLRTVRASYSFLYPLPGFGRRKSWYFLRRGQLAGVFAAPHDRRTALRSLARLDEVYTSAPAIETQHEDLDLVWLIARWFAKHPHERTRALSVAQARRHCAGLLRPRQPK